MQRRRSAVAGKASLEAGVSDRSVSVGEIRSRSWPKQKSFLVSVTLLALLELCFLFKVFGGVTYFTALVLILH